MNHGIFRIFKVMIYSYAGLKVLWRGEEAFRQEVVLGVVAGAILFWLGASNVDLAIFCALMLILFSIEALNTGLEHIADKIDSSKNDFTKNVKDLGAVAVFFVILLPVSWFFFVLTKLV